MSIALEVKPQKPWKKSPQERSTAGGLVILSVIVSYIFVGVTPMKGALAYVGIFFLVYTAADFAYNFWKLGIQAGKDAIARSFATFGLCIAILPIISILITVFNRGKAGLHFGMLIHDMSKNSVNDPIAQGGLLHALIGTFIVVAIALIISLPLEFVPPCI
ncbi:MAG: hypothetical protein WDO06_07885 [Actinomycetota bacterium]